MKTVKVKLLKDIPEYGEKGANISLPPRLALSWSRKGRVKLTEKLEGRDLPELAPMRVTMRSFKVEQPETRQDDAPEEAPVVEKEADTADAPQKPQLVPAGRGWFYVESGGEYVQKEDGEPKKFRKRDAKAYIKSL